MIGVTTSGDPGGRFVTGEVVETARGLIKGSKGMMLLWGFMFGGVNLLILVAYMLLASPDRPVGGWTQEALNAVLGALSSFGGVTLGLTRAAREPMRFGKFFRFADRWPQALLFSVPFYLLGGLAVRFVPVWGWVVLVLLTFPTAFVTQFIFDRGMGVMEALRCSYLLVTDNLGEYLKFVGLLLALAAPMVVLYVLGITVFYPLGFALAGLVSMVAMVWLAPFVAIGMGVAYARAWGLEGEYAD